jgi:hypothetical protein
MGPGNFSTEDKQKVIEYLNFVAKKATFEMNTQEVIEYFKMLSFMQQTLLQKVDANILEVSKVVEQPKEETSQSLEPKKRK